MKQRGFTLIELLVALGVAAIMLLALTASYQAVAVGGMRADAVVTTQNDARNAINLITSDAQAAGFMLTGPAGQGQCNKVLAYGPGSPNNNAAFTLLAVSATPQATGSTVPGTTQSMAYVAPGANTPPSDAITFVYNNAFGAAAALGNQGVAVTRVTSGTDNDASLFVANVAGFNSGDVDMLVLPTVGACIRLQITNIGGVAANNIVHNSGTNGSALNPPTGFSAFNGLLPRSITATDLQQAYVQNMGAANSADGLIQVTYSIRVDNGVPTLFRTVVDSTGVILQDSAIAANVVYLRALFAPLAADGTLQPFVPWATNLGPVGAVQFALMVQRKNVGSRQVPPDVNVLDVNNVPNNSGFESTVYSRTVFLRNVAWSQ